MRFYKAFGAALIAACITATAAFAQPYNSSLAESVSTLQQKNDAEKKEKKDFKGEECKKGRGLKKQKDPIKALESKKEKIQKLLKEGKITKEKADAITAKIDAKIKEIQEFNKLPLKQKKEKLISNFKASIERKVKEGKLSQDKADELIKKFNEKVQKWDGSGYPRFFKKGFNKYRDSDKKE